MIKPMLAMPMDKVSITNWNDWAVEQKFDGWRVIINKRGASVEAWTRPRRRANGDKSMALVQLPDLAPGRLPQHLHSVMQLLPDALYDGELLGGRTSTDVGARKYQPALRLVVFDLLKLGAVEVMGRTYDERRAMLAGMFVLHHAIRYESTGAPVNTGEVVLAESVHVAHATDVKAVFEHVRKEGGEGVMLKRRAATYQPGKRSRDLVKVKNLETAVCVVIGFEPTKGKVLNRGAFAKVVLEDVNGNRTSVKTNPDAQIAAFEREWDQRSSVTTHSDDPARLHPGGVKTPGCHPAIGRKLRIEYQDYTPEGGYRHPRWDRWEDE